MVSRRSCAFKWPYCVRPDVRRVVLYGASPAACVAWQGQHFRAHHDAQGSLFTRNNEVQIRLQLHSSCVALSNLRCQGFLQRNAAPLHSMC